MTDVKLFLELAEALGAAVGASRVAVDDGRFARSQQIVMRWGLVLMGSALLVGLAAAWWLSRQLGALRAYADAVRSGAYPDDAHSY